MKKTLIAFFIALSTFTFGQEQSINTTTASAEFVFLAKETIGTLSEVTAAVSINKEDLSKSVVTGSVNVASLSTENDRRDEHLKSEDFFDAEKYPTMLFESTGLEFIDKQLIAKGSLTIKDVSKDVEFIVTEEEGSLVFSSLIYCSDFGIQLRDDREDNKVEVRVIIPFAK